MAWACIRSGISRSKSRLQRYEDASRPLSGIEIRFASKPSYREFFFTTAWTANYLQQFRFLLFVKKEKMRSESLAKIDDFSGRKMRSGEFPERFSHFLFPIETRVRSRKFYCIREARFDKSTRREREINFSIKTTTRLNLIFLYPNSIVIRTTDVLFSNKYIRD